MIQRDEILLIMVSYHRYTKDKAKIDLSEEILN